MDADDHFIDSDFYAHNLVGIAQREMGCNTELILKLETRSKSAPEGIRWLPLCVENEGGKDHEQTGLIFLVFTKPVLDAQGELSHSTLVWIDLGTSER